MGLLPAAVVEHHRLGQAGGAGGVDVEQRIAQEGLVGALRVLAGTTLDRGGQVGEAFRGGARVGQGVLVGEVEEVLLQVQIVTDFLDHVHQLLTDDRRLGLHQVEAVYQHFPFLGGVDQGGAHAQFGTADKRGRKLRTVLHVQGHGVAFLQADGGQVVGDAVGPGVELAIGVAAVAVNHREAVRIVRRHLLESHAQPQRPGGVGDLAHPGAFDQARQVHHHFRHFAQHFGQGNNVGLTHSVSFHRVSLLQAAVWIFWNNQSCSPSDSSGRKATISRAVSITAIGSRNFS